MPSWQECLQDPSNSTEEDVDNSEELIFPAQTAQTGILAVKLGYCYDLAIPEPYEGSSYRADPDSRHERWLPYAVMEYENFRVSTEAEYCGKRGRESVVLFARPKAGQEFLFEVSAFSELRVCLFARYSDASAGHQAVSLGFVRVNPFGETWAPGEQCVHVQGGNGNGMLKLTASYSEKEVSCLNDRSEWFVYGELGSGDLVYVEKGDTGRSYGKKTMPLVDITLRSDILEHPFIVPLKFAFRSPEGVSLLSPLVSGGQLFHHLQRAQRFKVDQARFYAAELICVLEYLHDKRIILTHLNTENILLDSFGHVSLCQPGLFGLEVKDGNRIVPAIAEYPAPELALNEEASTAVDWWALGIFIYEMLTGIPPFFHQDTDKRRLKISNEAPVFPEYLPSSAKSILTRLLDKDPAKRLGANGVSEVKAHAFFEGVNWHELLERKHTTPFKPHDAMMVFWVESPNRKEPEARIKIEDGIVYKELNLFGTPFWSKIGKVEDEDGETSTSAPASQPEDDGWELVWEQTSYRFHFRNRFTNEISPGRLPDGHSSLWSVRRCPRALPPVDLNPAIDTSPPLGERKEALAAALAAGYSKNVFSQILGYGTDLSLNVSILRYNQALRPDDTPYEINLTPLEWAVEHGRFDLVNLFLENGADANFTIEETHGPALMKAVRRRNRELVDILVRKTNRATSTRALCLAVKKQDTAIVNTLLANGVQCDFEESDVPLPPRFHECNLGCAEPLTATAFTPPLARAVERDNPGIVRELLAHGANANAAYHDMHGVSTRFPCGRVIQAAMERGNSEIVQLPLDGGADINLAHSFWPVPIWPMPCHICVPVHREVYIKVKASLAAAVVARR
ncbi:hypothetical protein FQN50_009589 [Emmonsiellopsis sp. PD_5]|nr:hypothetical protein FQN50_009589 [Emmonsiellopsis sp. PD_5]